MYFALLACHTDFCGTIRAGAFCFDGRDADADFVRYALGSNRRYFNVGFVAVSETDRFGNIIASQDVPTLTAGLSAHATQTAMSLAVKDIIAIACRAQKPISIEYLDFAKKKAQLSYASPKVQRMLAAFAYTQFAQTIGARAHDAGLDVIEVRAAYSSKIGAQKYARRYGLSGHRAAAFVVARRSQSFPDCLKPSSRKRFATTCKDRGELVPVRLNVKGGRGKARLETYVRPPYTAIPVAPRGRKRSEMATSDVRGETPRCNFYVSTRSDVGGHATAIFEAAGEMSIELGTVSDRPGDCAAADQLGGHVTP